MNLRSPRLWWATVLSCTAAAVTAVLVVSIASGAPRTALTYDPPAPLATPLDKEGLAATVKAFIDGEGLSDQSVRQVDFYATTRGEAQLAQGSGAIKSEEPAFLVVIRGSLVLTRFPVPAGVDPAMKANVVTLTVSRATGLITDIGVGAEISEFRLGRLGAPTSLTN